MKKLVVLALLAWIESATAQSILIKKVELAGDKVIVSYALLDPNPSNEYQLRLYSSIDNFISPLSKVTGDVGDDVKSGEDRKIEWRMREEFGPYKGRIALELRGKMYVPFVKLQNFDLQKGYKRGKTIELAWRGGATNPINIELYKGNQRISGDANLQNNGGHTVYIPSSAKPGKDYRLKITDTKSNDVIYTGAFAVKPVVPMALKVLPVILIGGAAVAAGGGGKDDNTPAATDIALPPLPGGP